MPFRAIIFDLDGTLLDTLDGIANAANRVLAARGFPTHPNPDYRAFIGEGVVRLMLRVLPEANRDDATVPACVEACVREYERGGNNSAVSSYSRDASGIGEGVVLIRPRAWNGPQQTSW